MSYTPIPPTGPKPSRRRPSIKSNTKSPNRKRGSVHNLREILRQNNIQTQKKNLEGLKNVLNLCPHESQYSPNNHLIKPRRTIIMEEIEKVEKDINKLEKAGRAKTKRIRRGAKAKRRKTKRRKANTRKTKKNGKKN